MNKYERAKVLTASKARVQKTCDKCGKSIEKGAEYFRESLGLLAKPPGVRLGNFCIACGKAKVR
jgi:hypothetical protein